MLRVLLLPDDTLPADRLHQAEFGGPHRTNPASDLRFGRIRIFGCALAISRMVVSLIPVFTRSKYSGQRRAARSIAVDSSMGVSRRLRDRTTSTLASNSSTCEPEAPLRWRPSVFSVGLSLKLPVTRRPINSREDAPLGQSPSSTRSPGDSNLRQAKAGKLVARPLKPHGRAGRPAMSNVVNRGSLGSALSANSDERESCSLTTCWRAL